ncbi:MAG TPA: SCO family protein [Phycisphaerae bacterium]|nr:SCO family protein [Phycisphaerae bacterium]HRW55547.1 SCO family protein [Phycisphaerae bacterium]
MTTIESPSHSSTRPDTQADPQTELRPGRWFWLGMLFSLAAVGGVAYLQYARVNDARTSPYTPAGALPVIAQLPDFALTERSGRTITLEDLRGRVWIADFIFTTCGGPCPIMTSRLGDFMQTLKEKNIPRVSAVSFTVDPETDTPEVLREYATMKLADDFDWLFLTGSQKALFDLSVRGFMLPAQKSEEGGDHGVDHSPRFILIDQKGRIRGYYEVVTNEEILAMEPGRFIGKPMNPDTKARLIDDIMKLLREEAQGR